MSASALTPVWDSIAANVERVSAEESVTLLVGGSFTGRSSILTRVAFRAKARGVSPALRIGSTLEWPAEIATSSAFVIDPEVPRPVDALITDIQAALLAGDGRRLIMTCTPDAMGALQAANLLHRCGTVFVRFVETEAIREKLDAEMDDLMHETGGHPLFLEAVLREVDANNPSSRRAMDSAKSRLGKYYKTLYARVPEALKGVLSALAASGQLTLPEATARGLNNEAFEELALWLLVREEQGQYRISARGFGRWLQEYVCVPSAPAADAPSEIVRSHERSLPRLRNESLSILHLSDLQFGGKHVFADYKETFERLKEDLERLRGSGLRRPDIVVISGDIGETGMPPEYEHAGHFVQKLYEYLELPTRSRIVMTPGNHDICWPISRLQENHSSLRPLRMAPFWQFWRAWYKEQASALWPEGRGFGVFPFADLETTLVCFNSCEQEDHENHVRLITERHIADATDELAKHERNVDSPLRIAVTHHGPLEHVDGQETLNNAAMIRKTLEANGFRLCLHGHVHEGGINVVNKLWLLAAGSLSVTGTELPGDARVGRVRHQYQLIVLGKASASGRPAMAYPREYDPFKVTKRGAGRWLPALVDDEGGAPRYWHEFGPVE